MNSRLAFALLSAATLALGAQTPIDLLRDDPTIRTGRTDVR